MRRKQRQKRKHGRRTLRALLVSALSIVSQLAAIFGTMVAILDTLHRW